MMIVPFLSPLFGGVNGILGDLNPLRQEGCRSVQTKFAFERTSFPTSSTVSEVKGIGYIDTMTVFLAS
jgi:hypothetical protein